MKITILISLGAAALYFLLSLSASAASLGGVESTYTQTLLTRLDAKDDVYRDIVKPDANGLSFVCFKDPKDEYYIGAGQFQTIDASIEAVAKILTDFDKYPQWTDGLVDSKSKKTGDDTYLVSTEQEIPIPLVSNIHTQFVYEVKTTKERVTLRYQLKKSDSLTAYDGLIILESLAPNKTKFTEYDTVNADWGVAKAMGAKKLWSDSLKAMYQGDLALKMQAENPETVLKDVLKKSLKTADQQDFKDCFEQRREMTFK